MILWSAGFIGCDNEDTVYEPEDYQPPTEEPQSADELIAEGKAELRAGRPRIAMDVFAEAIETDPRNADAHYGSMLSGALYLWDLASLATVMISDPDTGHHLDTEKSVDPNREMLRLVLSYIHEGVFSPAGEATRSGALWNANNDSPPFYVDGVPVFFRLQQVASLGNEFDIPEREACRALGNLFDGFGATLLALKIDFNLNYIMNADFDGDTMDVVGEIVHMIDDMLNDPGYPEFLQIDPDMMDDVAQARIHLGEGLAGLHATLGAIRVESPPKELDVLTYNDRNDNGYYDDGEPFAVPGIRELSDGDMELLLAVETITYDLGAAFLDRTDSDFAPGEDNPFHLSSLNELLVALGLPSIIPDGLTVDAAAFYEDLHPDTIRDFLQTIVNLLKPLFPESKSTAEYAS